MAPKFGTSGLRGLVTELSEPLVRDYTRSFLAALNVDGAVHVGRDLRRSSPDIAAFVTSAVTAAGYDVVDHGDLPTPALALIAMDAGEAAIMVTGSHIPADRNGLKFYKPEGEIEKDDEAAILAGLGTPKDPSPSPGTVTESKDALRAYGARYVSAFGDGSLTGLKIGVYEHSSVARDVLADVLSRLGADIVRLARSDAFVAVDTEAIDDKTRAMLQGWCQQHGLDAIVSTDGDADRPMVADATGTIVPGDVLGPLTARRLGAEVICTPVSSNTLVDAMGAFSEVKRTRIGSPYVIAAMEAAPAGARTAGYEANGGFVLGYQADGPAGPIAPLMTRDCLLPIVTPLVAMREEGSDLAGLVKALPQRFTAADRLTEVPIEKAQALLAKLTDSQTARRDMLALDSVETGIDLTDGLRITYDDGVILHFRPSGNAPEFRCYTEAETRERAGALLQSTLTATRRMLDAL